MVQVCDIFSISDIDERLAELNRNQFRAVSIANLGHNQCLLLYEPLPPRECPPDRIPEYLRPDRPLG
jgi:hypothetical protein